MEKQLSNQNSRMVYMKKDSVLPVKLLYKQVIYLADNQCAILCDNKILLLNFMTLNIKYFEFQNNGIKIKNDMKRHILPYKDKGICFRQSYNVFYFIDKNLQSQFCKEINFEVIGCLWSSPQKQVFINVFDSEKQQYRCFNIQNNEYCFSQKNILSSNLGHTVKVQKQQNQLILQKLDKTNLKYLKLNRNIKFQYYSNYLQRQSNEYQIVNIFPLKQGFIIVEQIYKKFTLILIKQQSQTKLKIFNNAQSAIIKNVNEDLHLIALIVTHCTTNTRFSNTFIVFDYLNIQTIFQNRYQNQVLLNNYKSGYQFSHDLKHYIQFKQQILSDQDFRTRLLNLRDISRNQCTILTHYQLQDKYKLFFHLIKKSIIGKLYGDSIMQKLIKVLF